MLTLNQRVPGSSPGAPTNQIDNLIWNGSRLATFLRLMHENVQACKLYYPERVEALEKIREKVKYSGTFIAPSALAALGSGVFGAVCQAGSQVCVAKLVA